MLRTPRSLILATVLCHTLAFAGSLEAWDRDLNGPGKYGSELKTMTGCKATITARLDPALAQQPWPDEGPTPGDVCAMVAEALYDLCRVTSDDPKLTEFTARVVNDNIDAIVCERSPVFTSMNIDSFVPSLTLKNKVLHVGMYSGKSPDGEKPRYTSRSVEGISRLLTASEVLQAKGPDGELLNYRQAALRSTFHEQLGEARGGTTNITRKKLEDYGLKLELSISDAAVLAAYDEIKRRTPDKLSDYRELGFPDFASEVFRSISDACRADDEGKEIKPACKRLKSVRVDTRKGLTTAEFDAKTGRLTLFIESEAQLRAEVEILEQKYHVGWSGKAPALWDVVMLPVMRVLVHDLHLPKAEVACRSCGSDWLWQSGVLEKPLDAPYSPPKRDEGPARKGGPSKKSRGR